LKAFEAPEMRVSLIPKGKERKLTNNANTIKAFSIMGSIKMVTQHWKGKKQSDDGPRI
jgi:hypothetical protein